MDDQREEAEERCPLTIDIMEMIGMENENTHVTATVTWNSGRVETFTEGLRKDGTPPIKFTRKANDLRNFPTVKSVKTVRHKNENT